MQHYRKIKVWERSHKITLKIYNITRSYPKDELYGITSQLRRSSSSICANIAEGANRTSNKDYVRFLRIAFGSASETQYFLELSKDLIYIDQETWYKLEKDINEIQKMLYGLIKSIQIRSTTRN